MSEQKLSVEIKAYLPSDSRMWKHGGSLYRGNAPYRSGSDGASLAIHFEDDSHGRWYDHVDKTGGFLPSLARKLGIQVNSNGRTAYNTDKPTSLASYEKLKGLPVGYLASRGWTDGIHEGRKCIFIPNPSGIRQVRFVDNAPNLKKYTWESAMPKDNEGKAILPFFGLKSALEQSKGFIVQCNGAGSVEVANFANIAAFCVLGGEGNFNKQHADMVMRKFDGKIILAFDNDKAGQDATELGIKLYGERAIPINLGGTDGFDLADFCILWQEQAATELEQRVKQGSVALPPRTVHEAAIAVIEQITGDRPLRGRLVPFPFTRMHQFGGGCKFMQAGLLTGVVAASGHGKTTWWQTLTEMLLTHPRQFGFLVDSQEFTPEVDHVKRLQRDITNVSYDDVSHHLYEMQVKSELVNSKYYRPEADLIEPKTLQAETIARIQKHTDNMRFQYSGHLEYAQKYNYIEDTLDYMKRRTSELRSQNKNVDLWIFDYLTLYYAKPVSLQGTDEQLFNVILKMIKDAANDMAIPVHVIVLLQPNKAPSNSQIASNKRLTRADMGYVNANHFNTIIALNSYYAPKVRWEHFDNAQEGAWCIDSYDPITGKPVMDKARLNDGTTAAMWECLKNTFGTEGLRSMRADFSKFTWLDRGWSPSDLCIPLDNGETD